MRHEDIQTTMDYYVAQDTDEVADELWREYGQVGPKSTDLGDTSGDTSPNSVSEASPHNDVTSM